FPHRAAAQLDLLYRHGGPGEPLMTLARPRVERTVERTGSITAVARARAPVRLRLGWLVPTIYIIFLMVPIYWLLNMSFKSTNEILGAFTLWPRTFTLANYREILTNPVWYTGYINSILYV